MNDIDKIKELLFGHEKKALDAITRRLETPETRSADIADVLPEAILRAKSRDDRLAKALAEPIESSLKEAIRRDPTEIADALFPVMGPAIRKAIAEALKSMVQGLNRALDSSLSPRARFAAWRAGIPLAEYVLQRSLVYRVDHAYLIRGENGMLVEKAVQSPIGNQRDEDAVSAMFTAIQDFVKDSFSQGNPGALQTADMGSYTLWAMHGPEATLVCVIRGVPPLTLRAELNAVLERIHLRFGDALSDFHGDKEALAGLDLELESCLDMQSLREENVEKKSLLSPAVIVLLLAVAAAIAWFAYRSYRQQVELNAVTAALRAAPGIVLTDSRLEKGRVIARGLRDPLAGTTETLLADAGVDTSRVTLELTPYQSLDPRFVEQRIVQALAPPDSVALSVDDGIVTMTGTASADWVQRASLVAGVLPGISGVDTSALRPDDVTLLASVMRRLDPPDSVTANVTDGRLSLTGQAPVAWIRRLNDRLSGIDGLVAVDAGSLSAGERSELRDLARRIGGATVYFDSSSGLSATARAQVRGLAPAILRFGELAVLLDAVPEVVLTGHADGTGTPQNNAALMVERARAVADELVLAGTPIDWLAAARGPDRSPGLPDAANRRVSFAAQAIDPTGQPLVFGQH